MEEIIVAQGDPLLDTTKPSVARLYDYLLGGKDNFAVDRAAAEQVVAAIPNAREAAQENRAFMRRAVRYMAAQGIRQFIDIGSGLPTVGNTHEIAQEVAPDARVVYIDNDPVVLTHGGAILATDPRTTVVTADMHSPAEVLANPQTTELIDFAEPVGVLLIAMVHFLTLEERPRVMGQMHDALASGSHIAITHITGDGKPAESVEEVEAVYAATRWPAYFRTREEIRGFFDGYELVDPGLVLLHDWRPDPKDPGPAPTGWLYGGVGRKR